MANDATKIIAGGGKVGGYAFSGPLTATAPSSVTAALTGFEGLGYVTDDGLQRSISVDTEEERDWNGDTVKVIQTSVTAEYTVTLMELNVAALSEVYGPDAVSEADGVITIAFTGEPLPHRKYVFELAEGDLAGRVVIGDGQVTTPGGGDVQFSKAASIKHEVTIRCYRDASGAFFHHYQEVSTDPDL